MQRLNLPYAKTYPFVLVADDLYRKHASVQSLLPLKPHKYFTPYELRGCNVPLPPFLIFFFCLRFCPQCLNNLSFTVEDA